MNRYCLTFALRYRDEAHPVDERITDKSFVVVEAIDEAAARTLAFEMFGGYWVSLYERDSLNFQRIVDEHGLTEVVMGDG